MENSYKIYQLLYFFVSRFAYQVINIQDQNTEADVVWLINPTNAVYPLIRITTRTLEQVIFEKERMNQTLELLRRQLPSGNGKFIDIHISQEKISADELYDSLCIEENHYSGAELNSFYPGIHAVLHHVNNPMQEIGAIVQSLNQNAIRAKQQKRALSMQKFSVTLAIMVLAALIFLLEVFLSQSMSVSAAMVSVGANYTMFTVGAGEYWRLFTSGFVHFSWIHLVANLYSLHQLGHFFERELGKIKMLTVLFLSIIGGSLCSLIFHNNVLSGGLSGGIYGLLGLYICSAIDKTGFSIDLLRLVYMPFFINFLPGIDMFAHLGGLLVGVMFYYIFLYRERRVAAIIGLVIIFLSSTVRLMRTEAITPIYYGVDREIIQVYRNIGLNAYADDVMVKLSDAYQKTFDYLEGK